MTAPILIVSPLDHEHSPGSVVIDADCGHRAWLSTSGAKQMQATPMKTMCMDCVDPAAVKNMTAVPGAEEELTALFGKRFADRAIKAMHDPKIFRRMQRRER